MKWIKINVIILICLMHSSKVYSQDAAIYCCLLPMVFFVDASYSASVQYGVINNKDYGNGQYTGMGFSWYPFQCVSDSHSHIGAGLNVSFSRVFGAGENKFMKTGFIEFNYFPKELDNPKLTHFDPFIGFDIGITNGINNEKMDDFLIGPIIGLHYHFSEVFSMSFRGRYHFINEKGTSNDLQFNLGVQYSICM